jgi:hypothetical protein
VLCFYLSDSLIFLGKLGKAPRLSLLKHGIVEIFEPSAMQSSASD